MDGAPVFYYDLGSPACYLAAERVMTALPAVPEWEPVHATEMGIAPGEVDRARIEAAAAGQGLQPIRWPARLPPDGRTAALAATYAKQIGRAVAFSLACFRQVFAAGRDLDDPDTILIAAAACEMHPSAVLRALELRSVQEALARASDRANEQGVTELPAIGLHGRLYQGADAAALGAAA